MRRSEYIEQYVEAVGRHARAAINADAMGLTDGEELDTDWHPAVIRQERAYLQSVRYNDGRFACETDSLRSEILAAYDKEREWRDAACERAQSHISGLNDALNASRRAEKERDAAESALKELRLDFANACDVGRRLDARVGQLITERDETIARADAAGSDLEELRAAALAWHREAREHANHGGNYSTMVAARDEMLRLARGGK